MQTRFFDCSLGTICTESRWGDFNALGAHLDLEGRGNSDAPDGYAPAPVQCPEARPTIRPADTLSIQESDWLRARDKNTFEAMLNVLPRLGVTGLDVEGYLRNLSESKGLLPRLGIAMSGGGYRALLNGAGALAAFDNRTANSTGPGQLGGILQATTYLCGLSGASWLVGSLYTQNSTTVESIIDAREGFLSQLWQFNDSVLRGPAELRTGQYYRELADAVDAKFKAGFNTSITDFWGRALSYQLVNASDGGPGHTYSSIANDSWFTKGEAPLPLVVALERAAGAIQVALNSTVIEFNPWEMGSYNAPNPAFAPLKYVGSAFARGDIPPDGDCVAGVDNTGFVVGTSSSLFNQAFLQIAQVEGAPNSLISMINSTLARVGDENRDVAVWPNPFFQYNSAKNPNANSKVMTLVDGGEGLENIPFHPLLWRARDVDVIIAIDSSADTTTHWPNGTSLVATYVNRMVNLQFNLRPTFFGCEATNMSKPGPLIVYLPNAPYTTFSNVSTFDLEFSTETRDAIIQNGYNVATRGNATVEEKWPECMACAILWRSFRRSGTPVPQACTDCFGFHCWSGALITGDPGTYSTKQIITTPRRFSR
ncbi:acyl transferase/acyl hydrolase/lysophospholipase [Rhypophila decipiens]|uniref:Lysophospholipase n=1 Tax=Rhypophila decipiens TaxID=261697 RepID=A0AAN7B2Y8_9PEZI|nr:acyl transferase/acyl hydrolase/lysophospholipase [Rhypophila decipiens]